MARDYAAEYARSVELAHERGFDSSREYKEAHAERTQLRETYHAQQEDGEFTGRDRHDYVAYLIDVWGYSLKEALAEMREEFGDTP